jgi:hypothetical protein
LGKRNLLIPNEVFQDWKKGTLEFDRSDVFFQASKFFLNKAVLNGYECSNISGKSQFYIKLSGNCEVLNI